MAAANFRDILEQVLAVEGGVSDRSLKDDPGGLTNRGVTQATFDRWRALHGLPPETVRKITSAEVEAIARENYWGPIQGDALAAGVDLAVFDFAFNSGPAQAVRDLQRTLGVHPDGIVGLQTLAALAVADHAQVIRVLCDRRLAFMKRLKNWKANAGGWTARVAHVRSQSLALCAGEVLNSPDAELTSMPLAKAPVPPPTPPKKSATVWAAITAPFLLIGNWIKDLLTQAPDFVQTALQAINPFAGKSEVADWLIQGLAGFGAVASAYVAFSVYRKKKAEASQ